MNKDAAVKAVGARLQGQESTRYRAAAVAVSAGAGVAVLVYRTLRGPAG
jgi:hypothetical protein